MKILLRFLAITILICTAGSANAQTPLKPRDTTITTAQTFAIIVGVSKYKYVRPLQFADKDAELFRDYLKSPAGGNVSNDNLFVLLNEKADNANFWSKGFQWLKAKKLQKGDKLFIYLAGHGDAIDEDQFFFLGYDCNPNGDKNNYLVSGAIQLFNLKKKIANETAKGVEVFFIMDACRTHELPGGTAGQNFLNSAITEKRAGEIIMLATGAGQESLEDASIGNGLFTYYLVNGLTGIADSMGKTDKKITLKEIQSYVNLNVPAVAQQRFNRKQLPFFCCTEKNESVVSVVDSLYLIKYLNIKMQLRKGPGNSFTGSAPQTIRSADTSLLETYNRFNEAVSGKNIFGRNGAVRHYEVLEKKFPGNPYTLDAKSTLAAVYINEAQSNVDRYLTCTDDASEKQKLEYTGSAALLEKAIAMVREDDEDFANSLLGRLYLLKSAGYNTSANAALQNAYAALAINPNGAYILNKLSLLHLENNRTDSAMYYAEKAAAIAPKWQCALNTLSQVRKKTGTPDNKPGTQAVKKPVRTGGFGGMIGGGISNLNPALAGRPATNIVDTRHVNAVKFEAGFFYTIALNDKISVRPAASFGFENPDIEFDRRNVNGTITTETIRQKLITAGVSVPLLMNFSEKKAAPYIFFGPSFTYIVSDDKAASDLLPLLKSVFSADAGLGVEIKFKTGFILSPELKYSAGLNNIRGATVTEYAASLSSLKKQGFSLNLYFRKK